MFILSNASFSVTLLNGIPMDATDNKHLCINLAFMLSHSSKLSDCKILEMAYYCFIIIDIDN